ncbi:GNAT family N-acetyltransferase [Erysipelothrix rhusiopathiae]|uniref:Acetyltransferase, GNAT family n=1 Tax=Erysipelothrix rhusiopathiae ATCC 19414 TaxID=525280 RepID=E7FVS5_ERYRH|nr:GNAT family N-acetyltransferase [Erysipelothrix rhusiopathiae]EFY08995.1 acetyltransferase, GNAT family [Erysipelothrix rhusiopathiae ATCC 19414]VEH83486.1 acetyltransferase [Erysipelothrix rhusiopathiae]
MKNDYLIIDLKNKPDLIDAAALWFHSKWDVPQEAYLESMNEGLKAKHSVPSWFIVTDQNEKIIAGVGVIENDFHTQVDLTPNVCALYVEEEYRNKGIAKKLLDNVCKNLSLSSIDEVYLITSHTNFYERCGWEFYDMIEENDGNMIRMYKHNNGQ